MHSEGRISATNVPADGGIVREGRRVLIEEAVCELNTSSVRDRESTWMEVCEGGRRERDVCRTGINEQRRFTPITHFSDQIVCVSGGGHKRGGGSVCKVASRDGCSTAQDEDGTRMCSRGDMREGRVCDGERERRSGC